jgi:hypothetical protein
MDLVTAFRLRESFARTAAKDLAEERFVGPDRQRVLDLFDAAMKRAQSDLEKHLPRIDEKRGPEILAALRSAARTRKRQRFPPRNRR